MPTYQYRCAKCGEQFEVWQSIHDDSLTLHDADCGGALSKVMGVTGIVLKGSGFYRNDSRAKPAREGKDESKPKETASTNGSGDKKQDGKKSDAATSPSKSESSKSEPSKT
jgi:putative FmdB family regulatory protein